MKKLGLIALCLSLVFLAGCSKSEIVGKDAVASGQTIAVDYVGKLVSGDVFDSSIEAEAKKSKNYSTQREYKPLEFTVGAGQMIPGFDKGVVGMKVGETKTVTIKPEDAYGPKDPQAIISVPMSQFSGLNQEIKVGMTFYNQMQQPATVVGFTGAKKESVLLDTNHPLAGETLIFEITVKAIK
ncbi:MAG TPA: peptidylprolyl isomerase [Candidatus Absconditabacterales bacterium]|nr:peptidylprolyl isomerase [Candidatus Absconditabacterales bacterium]HMT27587.1 peptidylprolyl isomerase [Candidatus Absconditabacterales bacterium]